ncbi:hypothetical protein KP509_05G061400 [Ceratopteris richardii]|uniref:Secreted protein n=1 Tax=Ceratopteris richardii TaxID=49495 RepID=A0A8T2UM64_CERRI|nr:hypothetical protein KP509_05G061400 [Ceratopteris richardii]
MQVMEASVVLTSFCHFIVLCQANVNRICQYMRPNILSLQGSQKNFQMLERFLEASTCWNTFVIFHAKNQELKPLNDCFSITADVLQIWKAIFHTYKFHFVSHSDSTLRTTSVYVSFVIFP